MSINSCTSCQSSGTTSTLFRENQKQEQINDLAAQAVRLQIQPDFTPDPTKILDIQA